ncbi:hypothetical protein C8R41DRAFT_810174, partial [Lentinula lateritia]
PGIIFLYILLTIIAASEALLSFFAQIPVPELHLPPLIHQGLSFQGLKYANFGQGKCQNWVLKYANSDGVW